MMESSQPRFGTACVLAGGRGRRMEGRDKLRLEFSGERLLARIARQLASRFVDLVAVSSRPDALEGLGYRVEPDTCSCGGPLAGLHAGLLAARSEWVYLVACDMPYFSAAWVDELERRIDESGASPLAAAARAGPFFEPFHAFYRRSLAGGIEAAFASAGDADKRPSMQSVVRGRPALLVDGPAAIPGAAAAGAVPLFFNVNTPDDLASAFDRIVGRAHTVASLESRTV